MSIDPATTVGAVRLRVADIGALTAFYERVLGLQTLDGGAALVRLGAPEGRALVELEAAPDAPARSPRSPGLFHLAVLVPSRAELARALRRVASSGWRLTGASDHLVSEALYLRDPEGNGIEIYRDRPRSEWAREPTGEIRMATHPLDLDGLLAAPGGEEPGDGMPPGTVVGHVHLQVSGLEGLEAFYAGALGLDVIVRSYTGALFLSAGGYHHHVGLNTWQSEGAPPAPEGALGLAHYSLGLPGGAARDRVSARLEAEGIETVELEEGPAARDPSGNLVVLTADA